MAAKSTEPRKEQAQLKSVATMIREAIERSGYKDVKDCARSIKVPYDLFNKVVGGHIPKDAQLIDYANKLGIDSRELVLAAYREKAPEEMKRYFNSVVLLERHSDTVRELLDLVDSFNSDQLNQLLHVARLVRGASRAQCRKSMGLLELYQEMPSALAEHFEALVLLALRREELKGLQTFRDALSDQKTARAGRRSRSQS
jgi:hypothetical protein